MAHVFTREVTLAEMPATEEHDTSSLESLPPNRRHLAYHRVINLVDEAWIDFLDGLDDLPPAVVGIVSITCDYAREVKPGMVTVTIQVTRIGTSSFALGFDVVQHDERAAHGSLVLVHKDYEAVRSRPLGEAQRAALARHLVETRAA